MDLSQMFLENENLVYFACSHWLEEFPLLKEDIIGEARIALWESCMGFDPSKGYKFSTYAVASIRRRVQARVFTYLSRDKRSLFKEVSLFSLLPIGWENENILWMDAAKDPMAEAGLQAAEVRGDLFDVIKKNASKAWILCRVMGYTAKEAGDVLGMKEKSVYSCSSRSQHRIREALRERGFTN